MSFFIYVIIFTVYVFYLFRVVMVVYNAGSWFYFEKFPHCK